MSGFMSTNTAMLILRLDKSRKLDMDKLRANAFTDALDANGRRFGWVGLGQLLDTSSFELALTDARFAGFSLRQDIRKPSAAAVKLQLAETVRKEEEEGKKVGSKRRRELREAIVARLTSQAEFAPGLIDCIWDMEKGLLYIAAASEKAALPVMEHFKASFGVEPEAIAPEKDMGAVFAAIQRDNGVTVGDYRVMPTGDALLASGLDQENRSAVSALNSPEAIDRALNDGLSITRQSLVAENDAESREIYFTLDNGLAVSGLRLPRAEKGADEEATFLINADICASVARLAEQLGGIAD